MKAIILAAGIASRLRPLTDNKPKCLLEIGDKCLLQRAMDGLIANGIKEFVVVTGYLHNQIEEFLQRYQGEAGITFIHNELYSSTNNIYSLVSASNICFANEAANEANIPMTRNINAKSINLFP